MEYNMEGVNQIQVNPQIDLTFASGLRSILRHDPDVILIGEIRDRETASIAIQASLTGHIVFPHSTRTTLHPPLPALWIWEWRTIFSHHASSASLPSGWCGSCALSVVKHTYRLLTCVRRLD